MDPKEPPIIDFAPFYGPESPAKERLISELRQACKEYGFFQLINHAVPAELQESVMRHSQDFFALPIETKEKYGKDIGGFNRGYERLRAQNFEKRTQGDLKEGFYMGKNLPHDDPYVVARKFGQGPNKYPAEVTDPLAFQNVMDEYHAALTALAMGIMQIIARTLHLDEDVFHDFCEHPVAVLRLLHYPPQGPKAAEDERGIGSHTDFGAITILLQDMTGGLQVWNHVSMQWVDVTPIPGAYVVNLGNMMMRWTNDQYLSNLHRVINKSGKERFSVPFFFSGNPDYTIRCLPSCENSKEGARYAPITVGEWMTGRYADTYSTSATKAIGELRNDLVEELSAR
ncbi:putative oxidoreductase [Aspergillus japonicus CBS 114.51]|uniref:Putative oxidoreductase n=1 Tax=Aspergillus japonicus CBS 114.51 TaxID=1448312 RepID=A0A8T8WJL4_ASPJA|nr:putative oxidoreductase [Aspergillus japonicus CBS 114.51]RAH75894.1 putative oxidoreductase [Aspergillus japonicus CBS 114.51]